MTTVHEDLGDETLESVSNGWPMIIASPKTLLETGEALGEALSGGA
jgi:hypothetical protein